jgi:hypothetical protein
MSYFVAMIRISLNYCRRLLSAATRRYSSTTDLKAALAEKIPIEQERIKKFRKNHGNSKIGEITVNMVGGSPPQPFLTRVL